MKAITRRRVVVGAATGAISGRLWSQAASVPVKLGQVSLSFYAVTGAVVHEVLERKGHVVQLETGPHEKMFPLLELGDIDLMAAAWLPEGHAAYWERYGKNSSEVARLYTGAKFFWAVPAYVPEAEVSTIADLARPAVVQRMASVIQGIGPGAAITTLSQAVLREYGLDKAGYTLRPGTAVEWTAAYDRARQDRRWIVSPTWTPQYLNHDGQLRPLQDPQGILGGLNHASLVAPTTRFAALPAGTRSTLSKIRLDLDTVTEMDWMVNVGKLTARDAARRWMQANETRVATWLA